MVFCCLPGIGVVPASEMMSIHLVSEAWEHVTNQDGTGLAWELFRMIYEPLGIQVKFDIVSYSRATYMVQHRRADASVGVYLNEYDHVLFPNMHYLQDRVLAIFKKGTVRTWQGETSLRGDVGWVRGYAFDKYLSVCVNFYEIDSRQAGLKRLQRGNLDFFLDTEVELYGALEEGDVDPVDFQIEQVIALNVYLAFADNERGRTLMKMFDERTTQLVQSGALKPLYARWKQPYPFTE